MEISILCNHVCERVFVKVKPKVVKSVHYCPATEKTIERTYTDLTSLDAYPSTAAYPTQVLYRTIFSRGMMNIPPPHPGQGDDDFPFPCFTMVGFFFGFLVLPLLVDSKFFFSVWGEYILKNTGGLYILDKSLILSFFKIIFPSHYKGFLVQHFFPPSCGK